MKIKHSKLHFILTIVWVVLLVPTTLLWRDSILWLCLMTWYAIVNSHLIAWLAAKAKEAAEKET